MTTNEIEEEMKWLDKFIKEHVNYLVNDPTDPRVGILAQDIIRGVFKKSLLAYGEKQYNKGLRQGMINVNALSK